MEVNFRELGASDLEALRELNRLFGEVFGMPETYGGNAPDDGYLRALLAKPHFIAVVAEKGGEMAGGLAAYMMEKYEQNRREIYIYDLAVRPAYRRQKIATGLIRRLRQTAEEKQAHLIFVQADFGDEPAAKLYESFGKKEHVLHFDIFKAGEKAEK